MQTRQTVTALAALALDDAFRLAFLLSVHLYQLNYVFLITLTLHSRTAVRSTTATYVPRTQTL